MSLTDRNSFRVPELTDPANIETAVGNLADDVDKRAFSIYTNPAARDLANPTPEQGNTCFITSFNLPMLYYGSYWGFYPGTPVAVIYATVDQSIPNGAFADVNFDSEVFDRLDGHSTVSNTHRYTPPIPGIYEVRAGVSFVGHTVGFRAVFITKNTAQQLGPDGSVGSPGTERATVNTVSIVTLNGTTDYVSATVYQDAGGPLSITNTDIIARAAMAVTYVGPS